MDEDVYLVIVHYSYDIDMPIKVFKTEEEAKKYLHDDFNKEVWAGLDEGRYTEDDINTEISEDGCYARITEFRYDSKGGHTDTTDWTIVEMKQRELIPQSYEGKE